MQQRSTQKRLGNRFKGVTNINNIRFLIDFLRFLTHR